MATIIVEDGSRVSGANSYISEAELNTYATDRGITIAGTDAVLLIQAMDYIESLNFIGYKSTDTQELQWPRTGVYLDAYPVDSDEIPQLLKDGLAEVALAIDADNGPNEDIERKTVRERVGEIEVEYSSGAAANTIVRKINTKLYKLLQGGGSQGLNFNVMRG